MQIQRGTATTISATFPVTEEIPSPGVVTLAVVLPDGTEVAPAVSGSGATRTASVTPAADMLMGFGSATWTSENLGAIAQEIEVVGGFLFTVAEARAWGDRALADEDAYTDEAIEAERERIAEEFAGIGGVSYVPLPATAIVDGTGRSSLLLPNMKIIRVRTVETREGATWTALDEDAMAALFVESWGQLSRECNYWTYGIRNVRVVYEHGFEPVPLPIKSVALRWCRYSMVPSDINERAISVSNQVGTEQLWTPGYSGRGKAIHPLPEVDRVLRMPKYNFRLPGMA